MYPAAVRSWFNFHHFSKSKLNPTIEFRLTFYGYIKEILGLFNNGETRYHITGYYCELKFLQH